MAQGRQGSRCIEAAGSKVNTTAILIFPASALRAAFERARTGVKTCAGAPSTGNIALRTTSAPSRFENHLLATGARLANMPTWIPAPVSISNETANRRNVLSA